MYFNNAGSVYTVDTATDTVEIAAVGPPCCDIDLMDLALSSNNTRLAAALFDYDADLNAESFTTLNDREVLNISYVFGMKLSPDGTLLFQPSTSGMDVFDGRLGTLRSRIAMPISFSPIYDALVADGKDNVLVGIVGSLASQIAILDLTSLPEPFPLPFATVGARTPVNFASRNVAGTASRTWKGVASRPAGNAFRPASDRNLRLSPRPPFGNRVPHTTPFVSPVLWPAIEPRVH